MGTYDYLLIIMFLVLVFLRVPITFSMLFTAFTYIVLSGKLPIIYLSQGMVSGVTNFTILAVPLFMTVGELMNSAGITKRLFSFADTMVGHMTGGLGHVNVLASLFFSGVSGSAAADAAGLGNIEIKAMVDKGYDVDFAVGITAASSIIGPIFPPSGAMILFGTLASVSIGSLFVGGMTVGVIMTIFLMTAVYLIAKKRNYYKREKSSIKEKVDAFKQSFWAIILPILLIVGLTSGFVTTTEVGALAVLYSLFLGIVVYKELRLKELKNILKRVVETVGMIMMLLSAGYVFATMLGAQKLPATIGQILFSLTGNKYILVLIILAFLLFLGTFMETSAAIMVSIPILLPIITQMGFSLVQMGIVIIFSLMIGLLTPPMAIVLFITSKIGKISFDRAFKAVRLYYIVFLIILLLIAFIPEITLWLPNLIYGSVR